jgi:peptide/nickel transport system ATP-binding protein/oligopeptide transport system ATP-binding protein
VNIARALTLNPDLIVCDEVVSALDVSTQADVLNLLADIQRASALTYVFISHNLGVVAHISDRVAVMYLGKFVEMGTPAQLRGSAAHPYTRALLSAEPVPLPTGMRANTRIILSGEVPNPISPPSGCRFRTRCPMAQGLCAEAEPEWRPMADPTHFAACHFAE